MKSIYRRSLLTGSVAAAATAALAQDDAQENAQGDAKPTKDQQYIMDAGMTRQEAECWKTVAEAAATFFALPELHPMDKQEVASAIHIIQNKLLSRPTYRKYLEAAKKGS